MSGDVEALVCEFANEGFVPEAMSYEGIAGWFIASDWLATQIAAAEQRGREDERERIGALADEWERSDDRTWISNCGGWLRDVLDEDRP